MDVPTKRLTKQTKPWDIRREVDSYGIACCRRGPKNTPEILLVCKRVTYAFINFILSKYHKSSNWEAVCKLLDQMTSEEKLDILTMNFDQLWHRAWLQQTNRISLFKKSKHQFESNFILPDGGSRLQNMIAASRNGRLRWEIPKGHCKTDEGSVACAVREFGEETGNPKSKYRIVSFKPHRTTFVDAGVRYNFRYYVAHSLSVVAAVNLGSDQQCSEISDVCWMDLNTIRTIDYDGRLLETCQQILATYKSS